MILSDMMISRNYSSYGDDKFNNSLEDYKKKLNPDLKVFSVDLRGYSQVLDLSDEFGEKNYIRIFGMSD